MRPPVNSFPENIQPPKQQQPCGSYHSEMAHMAPVPNQNWTSISLTVSIRPDDGIIRPLMGGPFPGQHDTPVPHFASEYVARPYPLGNYLEKTNTLRFIMFLKRL
jgi:hypothetical protein